MRGLHDMPFDLDKAKLNLETKLGRLEAYIAKFAALEAALHLGLLNRGVLVTPFHNMMLCSPVTSAGDADRLVAALDACLGELT